MNAVIRTDEPELCGICLEAFSFQDQAFTHAGGESHGFHRRCLATWLTYNQTCPNDRSPIDASSLFSRTELVMLRFKQELSYITRIVEEVFVIAGRTVIARTIGIQTEIETGAVARTRDVGAVAIAGGVGALAGVVAMAGGQAVVGGLAVALAIAAGLGGAAIPGEILEEEVVERAARVILENWQD